MTILVNFGIRWRFGVFLELCHGGDFCGIWCFGLGHSGGADGE